MSYSGPFVTTYTKGSIPQFEERRERYRQKVPYIERLPYKLTKVWQELVSNPWGMTPTSLPSVEVSAASFPDALNKAYGKFTEAARDTVNIAVNIAERKQAIDAIAKRSSQILRFARSMRSFRFGEALQVLELDVLTQKHSRNLTKVRYRNDKGVVREATFKRRAHAFGDNFLEVHFGWEPLVKDIGASIVMMHTPIFNKLLRHKVVGKGTQTTSVPPTPTVADFSIVIAGHWPKAHVRIDSDILVEDANALRLNQLGFVNPAVIAWELVPFSFVVDWFANVSQVLSAWTDFVGMSLVNSTTTVYANYADTAYYRNGPGGSWDRPYVTLPIYKRKGVIVKRVSGVTGPVLALKPSKWPSATRGFTAVSLLTQFLKRP